MLVKTMVMVALVTAGAAAPAPAQTARDSVPAKTCIMPERTGTFRVVATRTNGNNGVLALLLLENIDGCLEATLVTDDRGPAAIDQLTMSSNLLKGRINITGEPAVFTVRFEDTRVAGSIIAKKQEWRIEGRKTS
jgi:hypothetical protein